MTTLTPVQILRAKLRETTAKTDQTTNRKTGGGDNASFPFWNTPVGQTTTGRFVQDADPTNPYFWVKREVIKLPFSGVLGGDFPTEKDVTVTVPCVDMFGMACPIIAHTRPWWNESDEKKEIARIYYKKRSWIFSGFVVNSPIVEEETPENPLRRWVINKSIYDIIYEALLDEEMVDMPTDVNGGRDFSIKKTQKGEWANYSSSKFSMNPRALSEAERAAIDKFGLHNLKDALGAVPTADAIDAIKAMFFDSLAGNPFDMASYGQFYRPYGGANNAPKTVPTKGTPAIQALENDEDVVQTPAVADAALDSNARAQAVLDRLRGKAKAV